MKKITLLLTLIMSSALWASYSTSYSDLIIKTFTSFTDGIRYESAYVHQHLVIMKYEGTALTEYILVQRKSKSENPDYHYITNVSVSSDSKQLSIEYADKRYTVFHMDKKSIDKNHKPCVGITVYKDTEGLDKDKLLSELNDLLAP